MVTRLPCAMLRHLLKPKKPLIIVCVHCEVLAEALRKYREHREYHTDQPDGGTAMKEINNEFVLRVNVQSMKGAVE